MARLNDLLVTGKSTLVGDVRLRQLKVPTESNGATLGPGSNGQVLKSNGTTVYWGADNDRYPGIASNDTLGLIKNGGDITVDQSTGTVSVNDNSHNHNIGTVTGTYTHDAYSYLTDATALTTLLKEIDTGLNNAAPKASPALTGTPTAPTQATTDNSTRIATTAFVHSLLSAVDAMRFKGTLGTGGTVTALPASHLAGDTYKVITAGTYAGKVCEAGDLIICVKDRTTANNDDWTVVQTNIDGAVTGPASVTTSDGVAVFSGTNGRVIKNSGYTIAKSVPSNAVFTDVSVNGVGNHYTPSANASKELSVDASGGNAATWGTTSMVTGVNIQRDAAGHVTGVTVDSIKMPANPDTGVTSVEVNGSGNAVTAASISGRKLTLTKGTSFLPTAGGSITGSLTVGGKLTQGTPSSDASITNMNRFATDLFVQGDGNAPNNPTVAGFYLGKSTTDDNRHMDIVSGGDYSYIDFNKASRGVDYDARLLVNVTNGLTTFQWGSSSDLTQKIFNVAGTLQQNGTNVALSSELTAHTSKTNNPHSVTAAQTGALPLSGGTMTGSIIMNNNSITGLNNIAFADPGPNEGISWTGGNGWNIQESPDDLTTNTAGNLQFIHGSTRRLTINAGGYVDINARLVVRGNGSSYNEGIRILPASNGWSNIFFSADSSLSGNHDGGWLIGRRGAAGSLCGVIGDFTIEHNDSSGKGLTLHKNGNMTIYGTKMSLNNGKGSVVYDSTYDCMSFVFA